MTVVGTLVASVEKGSIGGIIYPEDPWHYRLVTPTTVDIQAGDMLLVRLLIRNYKLGATEKTFNPDDMAFNDEASPWTYLGAYHEEVTDATETLPVVVAWYARKLSGGIPGSTHIAYINPNRGKVGFPFAIGSGTSGDASWQTKETPKVWVLRGVNSIAGLHTAWSNGRPLSSSGHSFSSPTDVIFFPWEMGMRDWSTAGNSSFVDWRYTDSVNGAVATHGEIGVAGKDTLYPFTSYYSDTASSVNAEDVYTGVDFIKPSSALMPLRPKITDKGPGYVTPGATLNLKWDFVDGFTGEQTQYALKKTKAGVTQWFVASSNSWTTTEAWNTSPLRSAVLPSTLANPGETVTVEVAVMCAGSAASFYSLPVTVSGLQPPEVTVTLAAISLAARVPSVRPTVSLTVTTAPGASYLGYQAEWKYEDGPGIYTGQAFGDNNGGLPPAVVTKTQSGTASSFTFASDVPNYAIVNLRVRVQQSGGAWSEWVTQRFQAWVATPTEPSVVASTSTHPTSGLPGVKLAIEWSNLALPGEGIYDWTARQVLVNVQRRVVGEDTWTEVGSFPNRIGNVLFELYDWASPAGVPMEYRVRAKDTMPDGGTIFSPFGYAAAPVTVPANACGWLIDIDKPELAVAVVEVERDAEVWDSGGTPVDLMSGPYPVVAYGQKRYKPRRGKLRTQTLGDEAALVNLLNSRGLLLWRGIRPYDAATGERVNEAVRWLRVVQEVSSAFSYQGPTTKREIEFSYIAQPPPHEQAGS